MDFGAFQSLYVKPELRILGNKTTQMKIEPKNSEILRYTTTVLR